MKVLKLGEIGSRIFAKFVQRKPGDGAKIIPMSPKRLRGVISNDRPVFVKSAANCTSALHIRIVFDHCHQLAVYLSASAKAKIDAKANRILGK